MLHRFLLLVAGIVLSTQASAATFELGGDESLNCRMKISGPIVEGDAERFRDFLAVLYDSVAVMDDYSEKDKIPDDLLYTPGQIRICLDGVGGSLSEAIEMADTLSYGYRYKEIKGGLSITRPLGTAIPPGARCTSACAVLFMAGGYFSHIAPGPNLRETNRVLHVNGRLGFHAPALIVTEGNYNERSVDQAFRIAVETTSRLSDRLEQYRFPPSLFQRMLSTPPKEMFYVDTVAQAASWEIDTAGAPRVERPTLGNLEFLCSNMLVVSD